MTGGLQIRLDAENPRRRKLPIVTDLATAIGAVEFQRIGMCKRWKEIRWIVGIGIECVKRIASGIGDVGVRLAPAVADVAADVDAAPIVKRRGRRRLVDRRLVDRGRQVGGECRAAQCKNQGGASRNWVKVTKH